MAESVADVGKQNLIIVGNGMTSQAFCRWLTDEQKGSEYAISVIGDEPRPAYDRVHLSEFFSGKSARDLELAPRDWYEKRNIQLVTGELIETIDRMNQTLVGSSGKIYEYDKLILATGSRPFVPPIPGVELDGVFVYRTIEDLEAILKWGARSRSAAVLGGGLLGLEAAKALRDMDLIPHVIEMAPGLMPRQLDRECAEELQARVERMGVNVHLTKRTQSIERHGDFLIIKYDSGESLSVDMVVISAGIRPRDELARDSGIIIGHRGGIVVNDELCTSDTNVFAIGECACHRDVVYGLVGPCYQMAKTLASRLTGGVEQFTGADRDAKLKLLGVDVSTFGEPIGQAVGASVITARVDGAARKLLLRDHRIVGALGVGSWPEADRIRGAISELRQPWGWQIRRFQKTGSLWQQQVANDVSLWPPDATVCSCLQIKHSDLTTACQRGCDTVQMLADQTGASTICGSCKPLLAQLVGKAGDVVETVAGWRGLLVASLTAVIAIVLMKLAGPIEFADSVTATRSDIDFFWRDEFWKQVSGYTLLGITVLTLLFSLRKRIKRINFGQFGTWRMAHGILGVATLVGVLAHTGLHWGSNLNFWLMSCFIGINLVGGFTGIIASLEPKVTAGMAMILRQWRPRMTLFHILLFWPLPILIAAHIFSVYYY